MGGRAERWAPLPTPKELLPFGQRDDGTPRLLLEYVLDAMVEAGVDRLVVPVLDEKASMVMRVLGARLSNGALITYVAAPGPTLLANLVTCAELLTGHDVVFAMPDTIFQPRDILRRCVSRLASGVEVVLGVFPSDRPDELDVVDHHDGRATAVRPKPRDPVEPAGAIWGVAAWGPGFTERLSVWPVDCGQAIGVVFKAAVAAGALCPVVPGDAYADLGTYQRYRNALVMWESGTTLVPRHAP